MDVEKQVQYWKARGIEDMDAARSLLDKGHLRHALFFAHLAIEKLLKAHVTRRTQDVPPKIHNLVRLAEIAELSLPRPRTDFLKQFNVYQLEGRYPDTADSKIDKQTAVSDLRQAEEFLKWLNNQL